MAHISDIRFLLARALAPRFQFNGRWIAVNSWARTAHTVPGKDGFSPLLSGLAGEGAPSDAERSLASLGNPGMGLTGAFPDYMSWYRALNFDYPFVDYSSDDAMDIDDAMMLGYGPAPSAGVEGPSAPTCLLKSIPSEVAEVLYHSLRFVAERKGKFAQIRYRTAPSGGARHPTDVGVLVGGEKVLWFDPLDRRFVTGGLRGLPEVSHTGGSVLLIASSVVRAMWRYRDVRAFRPVLIDAGHVIGDLEAGFQARGWTTAFVPWAGMTEGPDSLTRAVLGILLAAPSDTAFSVTPRSTGASSSNELIASPYVSLVAGDGGLTLRGHEAQRSTTVSSAAAAAIAYSVPSSRGDRPTTRSDIVRRTGIELDEIDNLVWAGALLPKPKGLAQWQESWEWSRHDWFPSLLAHLEARRLDGSRTACTQSRPDLSLPDYEAASARRRTRRAFSARPLRAETINAVLDRVRSHGGPVLVGVLAASEAHRRGLFKLVDGQLVEHGAPLNAEDVRSIAIGQPWIGDCPLVVWLIARPEDAVSASSWEESVIALGRVAQSAALTLEDGIGMFQTPALIDSRLESVLGVNAVDGAYMLAFGYDGVTAVSA